MKKIKPIITFILLTAIFSVLCFHFFSLKTRNKSIDDQWETYTKTDNHINSYKTSSEEIEATTLPVKPKITKIKRRPAHKENKPKRPLFEGRLVQADHPHLYNLDRPNFTIINHENHLWKELLATELLRFQSEQTKVHIKKESGLLILKNNIGKLAEKVIITYVHSDGKKYAAHALVDPENGKIMESWNKTRYDNFIPEQTGLTPSGEL